MLVKDRAPTVTLHEMTFPGPTGEERRAVGVFVRVKLEPFGDGIRRHERTLTGPKEDRYRCSRRPAPTSPRWSWCTMPTGRARGELLAALTAGEPDAVATTDDGVRHRVWVAPASSGRDVEDGAGPAVDPEAVLADELLAVVGASPLTIADGHHRYETALRYREERGQNRACESDPAWDYVFALLYHVDDAPPVLPTHRVLLERPRQGRRCWTRSGTCSPWSGWPDPDAVLARMASAAPAGEADATGTGPHRLRERRRRGDPAPLDPRRSRRSWTRRRAPHRVAWT